MGLVVTLFGVVTEQRRGMATDSLHGDLSVPQSGWRCPDGEEEEDWDAGNTPTLPVNDDDEQPYLSSFKRGIFSLCKFFDGLLP